MLTRRHFLRNSSTVAVGGLVASATLSRAADSSTPAPSVIKVGLIGCGGRGTGAALQALKADPGVRLTALADVFADRLDSSLATLKKMTAVANRIDVTPATSFVGLDAYQKVIDSGVDVVLLASTPAFRPEHFRAAVAAGKHVFCEKPVAVDGPGIRSVLASAAEAQRKNLSVMSGFCWRYDPRMRATVAQIHAGAIGDLRAIIATYHTGTLTTKFPGTRTPGQTDLEWQLRNWYNFTWLSGDHLVEQAIHNVDKIAWLMKQEMPTQAIAVGGRTVPAYGNTYDNFSVAYEYASGVRATLSCRQHDGVYNEVTDYVMGTEGIFSNGRLATQGITGKTNWKYTGPTRDMYQVEHDELFAAIRAGKPVNDGISMAHSTLMAIMGRMAAYTGQVVTWDRALNSEEVLVPATLDWNAPRPVAARAIPGQTKLA
ncbi:MAG: Gfo/Idh/MocA family oxidoreductase [Verrucomicrobia bacterium]|jgi:predicted dehydrogenase|nr:Gfo/Idh/MocA family oxidoreductase [Verrucomicrobiota bacterium]